jgi:hypothetical protein
LISKSSIENWNLKSSSKTTQKTTQQQILTPKSNWRLRVPNKSLEKISIENWNLKSSSKTTQKTTQQQILTPKSNRRLRVPNKSLETFYRAVKNKLIWANQQITQLAPDILIKEDRTCLKILKDNPHIIIKKLDKGSAVVIMNTSDYLREGYRQFNDQQVYQKLESGPNNKKVIKIYKVIQEMVEKMDSHLITDKPKPGRFYLLPKIHKKEIPGRPICSSIFHSTNRIGKFVIEHIKRFVP